MFGLFVLIVSLHAYYFSCWLFVANRKNFGIDWIEGFYGGKKLVELLL